jgi:thiol-disulfide isomerase/thioredoxin
MLLFLRPHDYFVNNYKELCTKLPGYSFVFFTSVDCEYCKDVEPAFYKLAETIEGCIFAVMSVDGDGRRIVEMAARTRMPFDYVPYLILYEHGRPIAQFVHDESNPENNFAKMHAFIVDQTTGGGNGERTVTAGVRGGRNAAYAQQQQYAIPSYAIGIPGNLAPMRSAIPAYSIGIPGNLAARRVCYIGGGTSAQD